LSNRTRDRKALRRIRNPSKPSPVKKKVLKKKRLLHKENVSEEKSRRERDDRGYRWMYIKRKNFHRKEGEAKDEFKKKNCVGHSR